ncbi:MULTISPECIES: polyphosphate polymerase domain-containing protein [unclassified Sedimentibacter]|uniref:polyphosphate polymerase domain-containing protein n=1 Tax=unclassified Sedimentibacter TaxID=2649220 RepID=UPI0027E17F47|nr:polyphosphate polymerase domain-containing protein [Sedimentibacter sp. MB35-C1]WMJ78015.1 polyphosphate polymerase domain-containing protein [Sedimentibacter sp. MB35-C1]
MNTNYVFKRTEKKYLIPEKKFNLFIKRIDSYMTVDKYGIHTICNIYYDTDTFDLIRKSIEKPSYKEKLRLRSYGIPNDNDSVFLELKKKYDHTVFKRRVELTLKEAENYLEHGIIPVEKNQILKEIDYFTKMYKPDKKIFIAYDRMALFGKEDKTLRITFDMDIRSRLHDLNLGSGDYGNPLKINGFLMEIKIPGSLPLWLANILSQLKIYPVSFSKYGTIYKDIVKENYIELFDYNKSNNSTDIRRKDKCLQVS